MKALVGYTGFVGSNLIEQTNFQKLYNSKNIHQAFHQEEFKLVVYSGVRAEKFLANQNPEQDWLHIEKTFENIKRIKTEKFILISTVDVYTDPFEVDENTLIDEQELQPYGRHRKILEDWVLNHIENSLIIRLPALYGKNLKKNFIFDMINLIPTMIKDDKYQSIKFDNTIDIDAYYMKQENGFYKVRDLNLDERNNLTNYFRNNSFNALSFTDSRNEYQFYNLKHLWNHIEIALRHNMKILCLNSEPISAGEIYQYVNEKCFLNVFTAQPIKYNIHSLYAKLFGGDNSYVFDKKFILEDIKSYVNERTSK